MDFNDKIRLLQLDNLAQRQVLSSQDQEEYWALVKQYQDESKMITIELDIAEFDLETSEPPTATEWVQGFNCTAEAAEVQSCPGGTSYRVTGSKEDLERLLADGGYEPLVEQPTIIPARW